jgi:hypothetical protein
MGVEVEIMKIGIIFSNLIEKKKPPLQQAWAELWVHCRFAVKTGTNLVLRQGRLKPEFWSATLRNNNGLWQDLKLRPSGWAI